MQRPGAPQALPASLAEWVKPRVAADATALCTQPSGRILFQTVTQLDISATQIRALLARGQSPRYLLPEAVLACIYDQALYRSPFG
jgi:nicotinate-nucleotide adenylyltransferase